MEAVGSENDKIMSYWEAVSYSASLPQCPGEGNGTPLQYSCLETPMDGGAWWAAVHGVTEGQTWLSNFTFTFHFHALEKEMATHSSVLTWRIPGMEEPDGLPSLGSHRVRHDWSDLAAAAAPGSSAIYAGKIRKSMKKVKVRFHNHKELGNHCTRQQNSAGERIMSPWQPEIFLLGELVGYTETFSKNWSWDWSIRTCVGVERHFKFEFSSLFFSFLLQSTYCQILLCKCKRAKIIFITHTHIQMFCTYV